MKSNLVRGVLIAACGMFLVAGCAFAKSEKIDVIYPTKVSRTLKLEPGHYKINVASKSNPAEVKFYNKNGKYIGEAKAKLVSETNKNSATEVDYNTVASNRAVLTEISPKGWTESLVFSHKKGGASGK